MIYYMIGDWVVYNGDTEYTDPIKIEGMDIATDMLITSDREDVGFNGVEPIPLTAEILEKNGWKESSLKDTRWTTLYECDGLPDIWKNSDGHFLIMIGLLDIILYSVHELQHALKLCRINNEIVL